MHPAFNGQLAIGWFKKVDQMVLVNKLITSEDDKSCRYVWMQQPADLAEKIIHVGESGSRRKNLSSDHDGFNVIVVKYLQYFVSRFPF